MADFLKVDLNALIEAAGRLDELGRRVQASVLGGQATSRLMAVEGQLPASRTGVAAGELGRALAQASGQIETAIQGFGLGLRVAAREYQRLDVLQGGAAVDLLGEAPAGPAR
jgi:hypothetical protein